MSKVVPIQKETEIKEEVVIRFCGDSGDGMQLTGSRFTDTTAFLGNDLATLPDYPAEIRAPAGSLAGVSGYQIHFSSKDIRTPGDAPDVLVAMNPAALKTNIGDLKEGGSLIVNSDAFTEENLKQAEAAVNRLTEFKNRLKSVKNSLSGSTTKLDIIEETRQSFEKEMDDDFNTPKAISHVFDLAKITNPLIDSGKLAEDDVGKIIELLNDINKILGIIPEKIQEIPPEIQKLVSERETARQTKDFTRADQLREEIKNLGYQIDDTAYGPLIKKSS